MAQAAVVEHSPLQPLMLVDSYSCDGFAVMRYFPLLSLQYHHSLKTRSQPQLSLIEHGLKAVVEAANQGLRDVSASVH
jgi:hypothetical protein